MSKILGLGSLNTSVSVEKLVAAKDSSFHVYNPTNGAWDKQTGAGTGLTYLTKTYHDEFLDMQFWVNGVDTNRTYTGAAWSTSTNVSDSPIANFIKSFGVRLFLVGVTITVGTTSIIFKSRIWWSNLPQQDANGNWVITWNLETGTDLASTAASAVITSAGSLFKTRGIKVGDPFYIIAGNNAGKYVVASVDTETQITLTTAVTNATNSQSFWVGGNWQDVRTDDGDVLKGVGENSSRLLLFKQSSLHRFDGSSLEQVKSVPGTSSHNSIVNLLGDTYYFHPLTGIWKYNGVTSKLISEPIWDIIAAISSANYPEIVGYTDNARFLKFFVGDLTANLQTGLPAISNAVIIYDALMDNWSLASLAHAISAVTPWVESNVPNIYAGSTSGQVYQLETGTNFAGAAIPFRLRTKHYYPISRDVTVNAERLENYVDRGGGLLIGYKRIKQPDVNDADYRPISQAFPVSEREMQGIQFEATESSSQASFLWEGITFYYSGAKLVR